MVVLHWLPMLCVGFLWLGKTQIYFSSRFYSLSKKQLFDSYLGLVLLKSVGLHPASLQAQFAAEDGVCFDFHDKENGCLSSSWSSVLLNYSTYKESDIFLSFSCGAVLLIK